MIYNINCFFITTITTNKLIIDNILTKLPLYSRFNYINNKKNEYNFCLKLYNITKDIEILKLIEEIYWIENKCE